MQKLNLIHTSREPTIFAHVKLRQCAQDLRVDAGFNKSCGIGRGGTGTFNVDGKVVSTEKLDQQNIRCPFSSTTRGLNRFRLRGIEVDLALKQLQRRGQVTAANGCRGVGAPAVARVLCARAGTRVSTVKVAAEIARALVFMGRCSISRWAEIQPPRS